MTNDERANVYRNLCEELSDFANAFIAATDAGVLKNFDEFSEAIHYVLVEAEDHYLRMTFDRESGQRYFDGEAECAEYWLRKNGMTCN